MQNEAVEITEDLLTDELCRSNWMNMVGQEGRVEIERKDQRNVKKELKAMWDDKEKFDNEKESVDFSMSEDQHEHLEILP